MENINEYLKNIPTCKLCPKNASGPDLSDGPSEKEKTSFLSLKSLIGVLVALTIGMGGFFYFGTGATYARHLENARLALERLETSLHGRMQAVFIPPVFAEEGEVSIDEDEIADLTEEVLNETEAAIEEVEDVEDPREAAAALEEVSEVQSDTIDVLADAADVITNEEVVEYVTAVLAATATQQAEVENALANVTVALASGVNEFSVDVSTSKDGTSTEFSSQVSEEEATALAEEAVNALMELIASGYGTSEEINKMRAKVERIEAALEEGKAGRLVGLCIAMQAKVRSIKRQGIREDETVPDEPESAEEPSLNKNNTDSDKTKGKPEKDYEKEHSKPQTPKPKSPSPSSEK